MEGKRDCIPSYHSPLGPKQIITAANYYLIGGYACAVLAHVHSCMKVPICNAEYIFNVILCPF